MRRSRTRKLTLEPLENRNLMAGNVTATLKVDGFGSNLFITGDNLENRISVESVGAGNIQVRGFSDSKGLSTSINGSANASQTFSNVRNGVFIHTQGGNDLVRVTNLVIGGSLLVDLGSGSDEAVLGRDKTGGDARFSNTPSGPLTVKFNLTTVGSFGNDLLYASDAHIKNNALISMGDGNDTVRMKRAVGSSAKVELGGDASIQTGFGIDTDDITGLLVGFTCTFDDIIGNVSVGANTLNLALDSATIKGTLNIYADDYNDTINVTNTSVTNFFNIATGLGNNIVKLSAIADELILEFDDGNDSLTLLNANIHMITVDGFGGNDTFDVRNTTSLDALFDGGLGTDSFVTSASQPNHISTLSKLGFP